LVFLRNFGESLISLANLSSRWDRWEAEDKKGSGDARRCHSFGVADRARPSPSKAVFQKRVGWISNRGYANVPAMTWGAVRQVCEQANRRSRQNVRDRSRLAQLSWLSWHRPIP
jgi:hypothetical protein